MIGQYCILSVAGIINSNENNTSIMLYKLISMSIFTPWTSVPNEPRRNMNGKDKLDKILALPDKRRELFHSDYNIDPTGLDLAMIEEYSQ